MEATPEPVHFDDLPYRLIGVPLLGVGIGWFTGLYRGAVPSQLIFWAATARFVVTSCIIWEGNRWLWSRVRGTSNWLDRPLRRFALLALGSLLWTVAASVGLLVLGELMLGHAEPAWELIRNSTLVTVAGVAFIVHSYETAYLICERRRERDERSGLELARAKAELAALTAQVDPHFVFNSVHTIIELNQESPELATEFAVALADVYRYVVQHGKRDLVPLAEELGLLEKYALLLRTRFGDGISVRLPKPAPHHRDLRIPPVSLQVLVENAIKHNRYTDRTPLEVWVELKGRSVVVRNEKRPLPKPSRGTHTGLITLDQRCKLICGPGIEIQEDGALFAVVVPLL